MWAIQASAAAALLIEPKCGKFYRARGSGGATPQVGRIRSLSWNLVIFDPCPPMCECIELAWPHHVEAAAPECGRGRDVASVSARAEIFVLGGWHLGLLYGCLSPPDLCALRFYDAV